MDNFKEFLDAAAKGENRHDLYLASREEIKFNMMRGLVAAAQQHGLIAHVKESSGKIVVGMAQARFMIPHPNMMGWAHGQVFTAMYNEDAVHTYVANRPKHLPDVSADDILAELRARVRP